MLTLDEKSLGGLGSHTEFPGPHPVQSVDLETGDAVLIIRGDKRSSCVPREKAFGQDELRTIVRAGVAAARRANKGWKLEDHPQLAAWLGEEAPAVKKTPKPATRELVAEK